jgi:hypothetical protein
VIDVQLLIKGNSINNDKKCLFMQLLPLIVS